MLLIRIGQKYVFIVCFIEIDTACDNLKVDMKVIADSMLIVMLSAGETTSMIMQTIIVNIKN